MQHKNVKEHIFRVRLISCTVSKLILCYRKSENRHGTELIFNFLSKGVLGHAFINVAS